MSERQRPGRRDARRTHLKPSGWTVKRDALGNAVLNWATRRTDEAEEVADKLLKRLESPDLTVVEEEVNTDNNDPYNHTTMTPRGDGRGR